MPALQRIERIDVTGMLCSCGSRLRNAGKDNGCFVLACTNPKCPMQYRIPDIDPRTLPFPWETPRQTVYGCRVCSHAIEEEQAKRTFRDLGKAMCKECENK